MIEKAGKIREDLHLLFYGSVYADKLQIIIAGDSAGGNLALSLLSQMLHIHLSLDLVRASNCMKYVLLISLRVSFATLSLSYTRNGQRDVTNSVILRKWAEHYHGIAKSDKYNQPLTAADIWWKGLGSKVHETCVMAGTDKTLFSDIEGFTQTPKMR